MAGSERKEEGQDTHIGYTHTQSQQPSLPNRLPSFTETTLTLFFLLSSICLSPFSDNSIAHTHADDNFVSILCPCNNDSRDWSALALKANGRA